MVSPPIPIHRVRTDGVVESLGGYLALENRLELDREGYPLLRRGSHLVEGDLPWVFRDMAPDGFLCARFSKWFPELGLQPRSSDWTRADVLRSLTERGHDLAGNLIVGEESLRRYKAIFVGRPPGQAPGPPRADARAHYRAFVDEIVTDDVGSSLGGARPKFALRLADGTGLLVKFTPLLSSELGRRWGALLRTEAHAAAVLREAGFSAVAASYVELDGRGYLEVERFDRIAGGGRRGHVTLYWLNAALYGETSPESVVRALVRDGHLPEEDERRFARLHAFSAAIANTDAHLGNYGLLLDDAGNARLAPAYDVLPMAFAPRHDELPDRFVGRAPPPSPEVRPLVAALVARVRGDPALDETFRRAWLTAVSG